MPGWGNLAAALLDNELENPKSVPNSKKFRNDSLIPIQKVLFDTEIFLYAFILRVEIKTNHIFSYNNRILIKTRRGFSH